MSKFLETIVTIPDELFKLYYISKAFNFDSDDCSDTQIFVYMICSRYHHFTAVTYDFPKRLGIFGCNLLLEVVHARIFFESQITMMEI